VLLSNLLVGCDSSAARESFKHASVMCSFGAVYIDTGAHKSSAVASVASVSNARWCCYLCMRCYMLLLHTPRPDRGCDALYHEPLYSVTGWAAGGAE
jgi:hypothetical protein